MKAWTATCRLHTCEGARCNTNLTLGAAVEADAARRRVKYWCLKGLEIPDCVGARAAHMDSGLSPRSFRDDDIPDEETMDTCAQDLGG